MGVPADPWACRRDGREWAGWGRAGETFALQIGAWDRRRRLWPVGPANAGPRRPGLFRVPGGPPSPRPLVGWVQSSSLDRLRFAVRSLVFLGAVSAVFLGAASAGGGVARGLGLAALTAGLAGSAFGAATGAGSIFGGSTFAGAEPTEATTLSMLWEAAAMLLVFPLEEPTSTVPRVAPSATAPILQTIHITVETRIGFAFPASSAAADHHVGL